jgi:hypothetical protein
MDIFSYEFVPSGWLIRKYEVQLNNRRVAYVFLVVRPALPCYVIKILNFTKKNLHQNSVKSGQKTKHKLVFYANIFIQSSKV